jgi:mono/diheme cytochrome c family protein
VSGFGRTATVLFIVLLAVIVRSAAPSADAQQAPATAAPTAASAEATFLNQYCIGCHNQRAKVGGLALDILDVSRVGPAS